MSIAICWLPCVWSIACIALAAFRLARIGNAVKFEQMPDDFHQFTPAQKKDFFRTQPDKSKKRLGVLITTPIIWIVGAIILFVSSNLVVTNAQAKAADMASQTATMLTIEPSATLTLRATYTSMYSATPSLQPTPERTATPRVIYSEKQTIVTVLVPGAPTIVPVVITQEVTRIITVVVTATFTETPTATPTETPTP